MKEVFSKDKQIAIAPMMGITDKHFRYFFRQISKYVTLYTEMIVAEALLHNNAEKFLDYHISEQPLVIQLGGSCPKTLAQASIKIENRGYSAINLNVGCPSDRVQAGQFGACLMTKPQLVAECVTAMRNASTLPITVKTRLGVDHHDNYEFLQHFISKVSAAGCNTFIIHARKAWLSGLNPKQNRTVPTLNYERVYQLQRDFPQLNFILNGGLTAFNQIKEHAFNLNGVMIGRLAYEQPLLFQKIDPWYLGTNTPSSNLETILNNYFTYCQQAIKHGHKTNLVLRPLMNLFYGQIGAKQWRYAITQSANIPLLLKLAKQLINKQEAA